jgi:hypothetical protein
MGGSFVSWGLGMAKQVWVSRRVGKYRVGAWVPAKLIAVGYLLFFALAVYGLFLAATKPDEDPSITAARKAWSTCYLAHGNDGRNCPPAPPLPK